MKKIETDIFNAKYLMAKDDSCTLTVTSRNKVCVTGLLFPNNGEDRIGSITYSQLQEDWKIDTRSLIDKQ